MFYSDDYSFTRVNCKLMLLESITIHLNKLISLYLFLPSIDVLTFVVNDLERVYDFLCQMKIPYFSFLHHFLISVPRILFANIKAA